VSDPKKAPSAAALKKIRTHIRAGKAEQQEKR
jgi:hypothetical protein